MARQPQHERRDLFTRVEEATHLLRSASPAAWLAYYLGSAPFVVFLFYFWSDMSRSPLARGHLLESSLLLALLYAWMKVWQAIFSGHLLALVEGREETARLPLRGWLRLIASQTLVHATMPWVLSFALIALVPGAWVYAFYHNVTILAMGHFRDGGRTKPLLAKSMTQSNYAPMENHCTMAVLLVFAMMVYLNLFVAFLIGTSLLSSLTGTENAFSRHHDLYFSTVLQALLISVSYLIVNPYVKALYVIRCFYGAARKSGADIEVSLRAMTMVKAAPLVLALVVWGAGTSAQGQAAYGSGNSRLTEQATPGALPDKELGLSIRDVLQGSEYQWRLPRESAGAEDNSWLGSNLRRIGPWLEDMQAAIGRVLGSIIDWLRGGGEESSVHHGTSSAWLAAMPKLVLGLVGVLIGALLWLLWKNWRQSRQTATMEADALPPEVNLESEHLLATQLPENEWLLLAREKLEAGELRLALRALFLATLAHLGEKRLLQIARFKSNGDYVRELGWRARGREDLSEGFTDQVRTFDRVWYGWHEVTRDLMDRFQEQHERITRHAA